MLLPVFVFQKNFLEFFWFTVEAYLRKNLLFATQCYKLCAEKIQKNYIYELSKDDDTPGRVYNVKADIQGIDKGFKG